MITQIVCCEEAVYYLLNVKYSIVLGGVQVSGLNGFTITETHIHSHDANTEDAETKSKRHVLFGK